MSGTTMGFVTDNPVPQTSGTSRKQASGTLLALAGEAPGAGTDTGSRLTSVPGSQPGFANRLSDAVRQLLQAETAETAAAETAAPDAAVSVTTMPGRRLAVAGLGATSPSVSATDGSTLAGDADASPVARVLSGDDAIAEGVPQVLTNPDRDVSPARDAASAVVAGTEPPGRQSASRPSSTHARDDTSALDASRDRASPAAQPDADSPEGDPDLLARPDNDSSTEALSRRSSTATASEPAVPDPLSAQAAEVKQGVAPVADARVIAAQVSDARVADAQVAGKSASTTAPEARPIERARGTDARIGNGATGVLADANGWQHALISPASALSDPATLSETAGRAELAGGEDSPSMLSGRLVSGRLGDATHRLGADGGNGDVLTDTDSTDTLVRRAVSETAGESPGVLAVRRALAGSTGAPSGQHAARTDTAVTPIDTASLSDTPLVEETGMRDQSRQDVSAGAAQRNETALAAAMSTSPRSAELPAGAMFHAVTGGTLRAVNSAPTESLAMPAGNTPGTLDLQSPQAGRVLADNVRWMVGEGLQVATVRVTPAGLGPVSVRIDRQDDVMTVAIAASQPSTRDALESMLPRLREHLGGTQQTVQVSVDSGTAFDSRQGSQDLARQMAGQGTASGFGGDQPGQSGERGAAATQSASRVSDDGAAYGVSDERTLLIGGAQGVGLFDEYI